MTKFELNMAIAEELYLNKVVKRNCEGEGVYIIQSKGEYVFVDYCNNWNDLMPLALEHKINHRHCYLAKEHNAVVNEYAYCTNVFNKSPQRALAECLLKVLKAKQCAK